jgi:sulfur relay (sulfurtransferase) complex TusBCD TusD component (DsrE family)
MVAADEIERTHLVALENVFSDPGAETTVSMTLAAAAENCIDLRTFLLVYGILCTVQSTKPSSNPSSFVQKPTM